MSCSVALGVRFCTHLSVILGVLTVVCNSSQPTSVIFARVDSIPKEQKINNTKHTHTVDTGTPYYKHRSIAFVRNWGDNVLVIKSIMKCSVCGNCLDAEVFFLLRSVLWIHSWPMNAHFLLHYMLCTHYNNPCTHKMLFVECLKHTGQSICTATNGACVCACAQ